MPRDSNYYILPSTSTHSRTFYRRNEILTKSDSRWMSKARRKCYANKIAPIWKKAFYKIQNPIIKTFSKQRVDENFFFMFIFIFEKEKACT